MSKHLDGLNICHRHKIGLALTVSLGITQNISVHKDLDLINRNGREGRYTFIFADYLLTRLKCRPVLIRPTSPVVTVTGVQGEGQFGLGLTLMRVPIRHRPVTALPVREGSVNVSNSLQATRAEFRSLFCYKRKKKLLNNNENRLK